MVLIMAHDTAQKIGWAKEAAAGTDPIEAAGDYWKFGVFTNTFDNLHPIERHHWESKYTGDQRYVNELDLVSTEAVQQVSFFPVNLIPWYMVLATGATHTATAGTNNEHTIDPSAPGTTLETYTIRAERTGGTAERFFSMTGCKARAINFSFNNLKQYHKLSATLVFVGEQTKQATLNSTYGSGGPKYPTTDSLMTGTEVNTRFGWDTSALLTWDYGADAIAYQNDLLNFNSQIVQNLNPEGIDGQTDIEYITEGTYEFRFGFQIFRGSDDSIYDDFIACTDPPDEHFLFKLMAGSTNYFQIEYQDVGIHQCQANYAKFQGTDRTLPTWDVMGVAENIQIKGKDQLSPTAAQNKYYGESL